MQTKLCLLASFLLASLFSLSQATSELSNKAAGFLANARNELEVKNNCQKAAIYYKMYKNSGKTDNSFSASLKAKCGSAAEVKSGFSADDDPIEILPASVNTDKLQRANKFYTDGRLLDAAILYMEYLEDNNVLFNKLNNSLAKKTLLEKVERCLGYAD